MKGGRYVPLKSATLKRTCNFEVFFEKKVAKKKFDYYITYDARKGLLQGTNQKPIAGQTRVIKE